MKRSLLVIIAILLAFSAIATVSAAETAKDNSLYIFDTSATTGSAFSTKMDPVWVNRGGLWKILMFRSLFLPDPTLTTMAPDLASSYQISSDGLTYTITMKKGVTWHDGVPLTAEDVVFSIQTALKTAQLNVIYSGVFNYIVGAEAWKKGTAQNLEGLSVKDGVITIKLIQPVGNTINVLGQFAIMPKHLLKDENPLTLHSAAFWAKPVGNGMYRIQEFNPGNYVTFVPYEKYDGQKPKIARLVLNLVSNPVTLAQAGKLDLRNTNVPEEIAGFSKIKGFSAYPVNIMFYRYFIMNIKDANGVENKALSDRRVRQALLYAIDIKSIAEGLYPGLTMPNYTGVPTALSAFDKTSEQYAFDPEKAKQLLKEAGFNFNKTLKLRFYYADQTSINFMTAVAQYLANIGIKTDVQKFQGDTTSELYKNRDYDIALKGLSAFGYEEWYGEYTSDNNNFVNIIGKDSPFDDKVDELRKATDSAKRELILKDLQKIEQKYLYKLPLFTIQNIYFVNTDRVKIAGSFGNPWFNYDMKFADWEIK